MTFLLNSKEYIDYDTLQIINHSSIYCRFQKTFANVAGLNTLEFKVHLGFLTLNNISCLCFQTNESGKVKKKEVYFKSKVTSFSSDNRDKSFPKESSSRLQTGRIVALTIKDQANLKTQPFSLLAVMY